MTRVLPELAGAELRQEVQVGKSVAIDVGGADSAAMVVVHELVRFARVIDDPVCKGDSGLRKLIAEMEIVIDA